MNGKDSFLESFSLLEEDNVDDLLLLLLLCLKVRISSITESMLGLAYGKAVPSSDIPRRALGIL